MHKLYYDDVTVGRPLGVSHRGCSRQGQPEEGSDLEGDHGLVDCQDGIPGCLSQEVLYRKLFQKKTSNLQGALLVQ